MARAWRTSTEEFKEHYVKHTVKQGGCSVMVLGCFSSSCCSQTCIYWRHYAKSEIKKAWYSTSKEACENLVNNMVRRLQDVIINKGGPTKISMI